MTLYNQPSTRNTPISGDVINGLTNLGRTNYFNGSVEKNRQKFYIHQFGKNNTNQQSQTIENHKGLSIKGNVIEPVSSEDNFTQGVDKHGNTVGSNDNEPLYVVVNNDGTAKGGLNATTQAFTQTYTTRAAAEAAITAQSGEHIILIGGSVRGSSRDILYYSNVLPLELGESPGAVNKVNVVNRSVEGKLVKYGFYHEIGHDQMVFYNDPGTLNQIFDELTQFAIESDEAIYLNDLLSASTTTQYTDPTVSTLGGVNANSEISYGSLVNFSETLDGLRMPMVTNVSAPHMGTDTVIVGSRRALIIPRQLKPTITHLRNNNDELVYTAVEHYSSSTPTFLGEIGKVGEFAIIVSDNPSLYTGAGDQASNLEISEFYTTGGRFDVFKCMVIGDGAYSHLSTLAYGEQLANAMQYKAYTNAPQSSDKPYGDSGIISFQKISGILPLKPHFIATLRCSVRSHYVD